MLTFAPIINTIAWLSLHKKDPAHHEIQEYLSTEFIEFVGMVLVSCSYWNKDLASMYFELCGYTVLSCAALWDVTYPVSNMSVFPFSIHIVIRSGYCHWNEAFGLLLLGIVAIGKYLIHDEIHHHPSMSLPYHSSASDHKKTDSLSHVSLPSSSLTSNPLNEDRDHSRSLALSQLGLGVPIGSHSAAGGMGIGLALGTTTRKGD